MFAAYKKTSLKPILLISALALLLTSLPQNAHSAQKIVSGAPCKTLNTKVTQNKMVYTCVKKGNKLVWNKGIAIKSAAPTKSPTQSATPTPTPTVKNVAYQPPSELGENIEICKVKEASNSRGFTGAGFPEWNSLTPKSGTVQWALIPIDFPNLSGESDFRNRVDEQMNLLS